MLYHFLYPLADAYSLFNLFKYISFRALIAALIGLIVAIIYGKYFIKQQGGQVYSVKKFIPETHHKKNKTPSMGGWVITLGLVIGILVSGNFNYDLVTLSLVGFILFSLVGYLDDITKLKVAHNKGISPKFKMRLQLAISIGLVGYLFINQADYPIKIFYPTEQIVSSSYVFLPFFKNYYFDLKYLYWVFAVFILVGSSNAVNITDGLDGLAVGLSLFVFFAFIIVSYLTGNKVFSEYLNIPYIEGAGEVTVFLCALAGACLGFLWYNSHPAQVFMGDTGSLALGGTMGLMAIILKVELLLPIIGGVFVIEVLSVILQVMVYKKWKKRIFKMSPLHHHFELLGWQESKIISRFWIIGVLLALVGIATLKVR